VKRTFAFLAVLVAAALGGGIASAAWLSLGGPGNAQAKATSVNAGNAPSVSASGSSVTVSWTASTLAGGTAVGGYVVKRYDALDAVQTVGAGCAGTITALTCTESSLTDGVWKYSVTPLRSNWAGAESAKISVTVDTTAPTAAITFPVSGNNYNATAYNAGCSPNTSNVCGTAADATGAQTVKVSIRQGTGNYWNGSAFNSATEVFNTATLTSPLGTSTDWRLPLTLSTKTSYTVRVQTVDTLANTQAAGTYAATSTFNHVATITASLSKVGTTKVKASGTTDLPKDTTFPVYVCTSGTCSSSNAVATLTDRKSVV
jgi:hypothetical protein